MKVRDILDRTAVVLQGNLGGSNPLEKITEVLKHNKSVFDQFNMVVTIFNKYPGLKDDSMNELNTYLKKSFKKCFTLIDWSNRGHQFGYIDLDKKGFSFVLVRQNVLLLKLNLIFR